MAAAQDILESQVASLTTKGLVARRFKINEQTYVESTIQAPAPPWDRSTYTILVAVPVAYRVGAGLDGFYIQLPYKFNDGAHSKVNGATLVADKRTFQLVSWHYADGKEWMQGQDTLETHLVHCRGFFFHRGARNAY